MPSDGRLVSDRCGGRAVVKRRGMSCGQTKVMSCGQKKGDELWSNEGDEEGGPGTKSERARERESESEGERIERALYASVCQCVRESERASERESDLPSNARTAEREHGLDSRQHTRVRSHVQHRHRLQQQRPCRQRTAPHAPVFPTRTSARRRAVRLVRVAPEDGEGEDEGGGLG
eukprot:3271930-Rhodomonas_salina.1